jgi:two-component system capsular synthesis sensor histidine kinase RcsC
MNRLMKYFQAMFARRRTDGAGDDDLGALRRHQRRLLYGGGGLLTLLLLGILAGVVALRVTSYQEGRFDEFRNAKLALDALFVQRDAGYVRTLNMSEYAWRNQRSEMTEAGAQHVRQFNANGQRATVSDGPEAMPWRVLGTGTVDWSTAKLDRYLGLVNELSITARTSIADRAQLEGTSTYFYDATGAFFAFGRGFTDENLGALSAGVDRKTLFARMALPQIDFTDGEGLQRARHGNPVLALYGSGLPQVTTSFGNDPVTGDRAIIGSFVAMDGEQPIGAFAVFEPVRRFVQRLREVTADDFIVVTHGGGIVFGTGPEGAAPAKVDAFRAADGWAAWRSGVSVHRHGGQFFISDRVKGTDWCLVHVYTWRDVWHARSTSIAIAIGLAALVLMGLWALLIRMDRGIFTPTLGRALQVYQSEELNRTIIETSPVGLCLIGVDDHLPILQNDLSRDHASLITGGVSLYQRLMRGHARSTGGHAGSSEFELPIALPGAAGFRRLLVAATRTTYRDRTVLLCVMRDITARVELEDRLRQARRDSELALAAAESANRAKSVFVATMSHEIRTPLNGILGHLELFARSSLDHGQHERLSRIRQSADSLMSIISDVLDFSKIEAGQLDIDVVTFEPRALIESVALLYAPAAQAKGIELRYRVEPELARTYKGGLTRIEQILRNLVSNAVKFTESGRVMLRASLARGATRTVRFEVFDSGIGMLPEQQAHVFQPFVQADAGIARRFGGTGLGLALCRQMSDLLGGSISVLSTSGVGSVFTVDVPLEAENGAEQGGELTGTGESLLLPFAKPQVPRRGLPPAGPVPPPTRGRVLLVDDQAVNRELISQQLELLGFEVETANDGEAALDAWGRGRHDVVLTDIGMPKLDGYGLCRALRRHDADLPVLAITASAAIVERTRCRRAGITELLLKPLSLDQLEAALSRNVGGRAAMA